MPQHAASVPKSVLVVESDVIVRHAVAEYLRGCGFMVIEGASAMEAKLVLQKGPEVDCLFADAQLAGGEDGFALAQWARRYRPQLNVILTSTLANKSELAAGLCSKLRSAPPAAQLRERIQSLRASRARKAGPHPPKTGSPGSRAKA